MTRSFAPGGRPASARGRVAAHPEPHAVGARDAADDAGDAASRNAGAVSAAASRLKKEDRRCE